MVLIAAEHDLYRATWSQEILDEMARSLKARRPDLEPSRIDRAALPCGDGNGQASSVWSAYAVTG